MSKPNELRFFTQSVELNKKYHEYLVENDIHFRASRNSLSLISVNEKTPELGISCKKHGDWNLDIIKSYKSQIDAKEEPGRSTPEKSLQAWIIRKALNNNGLLPFNESVKFITSELAFNGVDNKKTVVDLIGYHVDKKCFVIIELKSQRLLTRIIEQVNNYYDIIERNKSFFNSIAELFELQLSDDPIKMIVWPIAKTSPLQRLSDEGIFEYAYSESDCAYEFVEYGIKL